MVMEALVRGEGYWEEGGGALMPALVPARGVSSGCPARGWIG